MVRESYIFFALGLTFAVDDVCDHGAGVPGLMEDNFGQERMSAS